MMNLPRLRLGCQKNCNMSKVKLLFYILFIAAIIFSTRLTESSASSLDAFLNKVKTVVKNQEKIEKKIVELESLLKVVRLRVEKGISL